MSRRSTQILKATLSALHYSGADKLFHRLHAPSGIIFMMHQVAPPSPEPFSPNRILRISPDFLERVICQVKERGFDILSMDEAADRLAEHRGRADRVPPFACFTFDDGYRDNLEEAYPVLKRHNVPFTIYVASAFADGIGDYWWLTLEEVIRRADSLTLDLKEGTFVFKTATLEQKIECFHRVYWVLRGIDERVARSLVGRLAHEYRYDPTAESAAIALDWDELRLLSRDPLVTIGAHTENHYALAKLDEATIRQEILQNVRRIEAELGCPCRHLSFPYGDESSAGPREFAIARELGLKTAVTTRKGLIETGGHSLHALPRLSLNGDYQHVRYLGPLLTGLPFKLLTAARAARRPVAHVQSWLRSRLRGRGPSESGT